MRAKLASLNDCAVPFLSRSASIFTGSGNTIKWLQKKRITNYVTIVTVVARFVTQYARVYVGR